MTEIIINALDWTWSLTEGQRAMLSFGIFFILISLFISYVTVDTEVRRRRWLQRLQRRLEP